MDMLDVVLETICELFTTIIRAIYNSLETVANMILYVFLPYSMFYIGQYFYSLENKFIAESRILNITQILKNKLLEGSHVLERKK